MEATIQVIFIFLTCLSIALAGPGAYVQWRDKIAFNPGEPVPDCKTQCYQRCGEPHKGVSVCASLLESVDPEPPANSNTTEVQLEKRSVKVPLKLVFYSPSLHIVSVKCQPCIQE